MKALDELQIKEFVKKGEKIQAIKLVVEQTGMELKEAKDYVDGLQDNESSHLSDSAIKENDMATYDFEKNSSFRQQTIEENDTQPNHKKGRKIIVCVIIPLLALGLFFLYRIYI